MQCEEQYAVLLQTCDGNRDNMISAPYLTKSEKIQDGVFPDSKFT